MKAFVIVGATGQGKSYFMKEMLSSIPNKNALMVYDVQGEYKDLFPYPFDKDVQKFLNKAVQVENAVLVFEEATSYFKTRSRSDQMEEILLSKRHTNNTIFLVFHSFGFVPKGIWHLINSVVIFKTNDNMKDIYYKFGNSDLVEAIKKINESEPLYDTVNEKYYSEHIIYDLI